MDCPVWDTGVLVMFQSVLYNQNPTAKEYWQETMWLIPSLEDLTPPNIKYAQCIIIFRNGNISYRRVKDYRGRA